MKYECWYCKKPTISKKIILKVYNCIMIPICFSCYYENKITQGKEEIIIKKSDKQLNNWGIKNPVIKKKHPEGLPLK